jgi:hypothetical protein
LLALLALAGLAVGIIMTILWLGSTSDLDDATAERDLAITERDVATESLTATQTELEATSSALASVEAELQTALSALEAPDAGAPGETADSTAEIAALEAEIAALEAESAELDALATAAVEENARLTQLLEVATAETVVDDPAETTADEADEAAPADPVGFDAAAAPGFARWVGELLSSSSGSSRLDEAASICLGTQVIELIGVEAIGVGQNNAASGAQRQAVIDAMIVAADNCGIDRGLIF